MKKSPWKTLNSKIVYKNPWYQVREDQVIKPDGGRGTYSVVETKAPAVFIVAISDDNKVYLEKLFRYPTKSWSWELPAGNSEGEDILLAAKRELKEETGMEAEDWSKIGEFQSMNGISGEKSYTLIARNLKQTDSNKKEEEGISEVDKFSWREIIEMIKDGRLTDGQSIAALMQAMIFLKVIK